MESGNQNAVTERKSDPYPNATEKATTKMRAPRQPGHFNGGAHRAGHERRDLAGGPGTAFRFPDRSGRMTPASTFSPFYPQLRAGGWILVRPRVSRCWPEPGVGQDWQATSRTVQEITSLRSDFQLMKASALAGRLHFHPLRDYKNSLILCLYVVLQGCWMETLSTHGTTVFRCKILPGCVSVSRFYTKTYG